MLQKQTDSVDETEEDKEGVQEIQGKVNIPIEINQPEVFICIFVYLTYLPLSRP
jgi:hypothetical protein